MDFYLPPDDILASFLIHYQFFIQHPFDKNVSSLIHTASYLTAEVRLTHLCNTARHSFASRNVLPAVCLGVHLLQFMCLFGLFSKTYYLHGFMQHPGPNTGLGYCLAPCGLGMGYPIQNTNLSSREYTLSDVCLKSVFDSLHIFLKVSFLKFSMLNRQAVALENFQSFGRYF